MKAKKRWVVVIVFVISTGLLWAAQGANTLSDVTFIGGLDILKGLQGVSVIIPPLSPDVEKYGLKREQLKTDVESKLRQEGILETRAMAILSVSVKILDSRKAPAVVRISVELDEVVRLRRDLTKECWATTWETDSVIILGTSPVKDIRDEIKNIARTFCVCHLAANPKGLPTEEKHNK